MNPPVVAAQNSKQRPLRSPDVVMRLERMGAFFPTRLSFMRTLIRRLNKEKAHVDRVIWEINDEGFGRAVYCVEVGGDVYSLVAFSNSLAPEKRTDRVIAEAWDTTYVLFDGVPDQDDLNRLEANAPKQEAGRFLPSEIILCRANKSVRLFDHVTSSLARGEQPDAVMINAIGYLMRSTAVYGNGKFGIADRAKYADRPALRGPFQAEMLAVWLMRGFTIDLVEHIARCKNPSLATGLSGTMKRNLGIGNSTGLGMAPFLVSHPVLINNWMMARETALARVCAINQPEQEILNRFFELLSRARKHVEQWSVADVRQMDRIEVLRAELPELENLTTHEWISRPNPWQRLVEASARWSLECQEFIVALVLEPYGNLIDDLTETMSSDVDAQLEPTMNTEELKALIKKHCGWAFEYDFDLQQTSAQFWYVSEEKLEPRLGNRFNEPGCELEMPLDIARQIQNFARDVETVDEMQNVAEFLLYHPQHRYIARRVQTLAHFPYSEIRDNLIGANCLPIDMLRCKLSFFGASKFDPKSDRWTRINMYQGAPLFDDIANGNADDWWLPVLEEGQK